MNSITTNIATELRAEIEECKKRRQQFALRKLSFTTALLGIGSITITANEHLPVHSTPLLFLVPVIAVAFDLYMLVEDFRINRAGDFLRTHEKYALQGETEWECFVVANPNIIVSLANLAVTIVLLIGAAALLWKAGPNITLFVSWIAAIAIVEAVVIWARGNRSFKPFAIPAEPSKEQVLLAEIRDLLKK